MATKLFGDGSTICFATHSKQGWAWKFPTVELVQDVPGNPLNKTGFAHGIVPVNEAGVDMIVLVGQNLDGFLSKVTYEAAPYP
jgi:hypothetical protein